MCFILRGFYFLWVSLTCKNEIYWKCNPWNFCPWKFARVRYKVLCQVILLGTCAKQLQLCWQYVHSMFQGIFFTFEQRYWQRPKPQSRCFSQVWKTAPEKEVSEVSMFTTRMEAMSTISVWSSRWIQNSLAVGENTRQGALWSQSAWFLDTKCPWLTWA